MRRHSSFKLPADCWHVPEGLAYGKVVCGLWLNKLVELGRYFEKTAVVWIGETRHESVWQLQLTAQRRSWRRGVRTFEISIAVNLMYEVVSKIFRTGAAIYTAVVVAWSTGSNKRNCEFRVLLRCFAATAWKRAKTSPRTLARTNLAASLWQRPVSHFRPHPAVSGEINNGCHLPPTVLPWFGTLWLLPTSKNEIEAERTPVWHYWGDPGPIAEFLTLTENDFKEAFQISRRRWDRCLHAGGTHFEGDGGR
jgi:hypothetical protein